MPAPASAGDDVFVTNNAQFMAIRRAVLLIADIGKGLRLAKQGRRRVLLGTTAAS